MKTAKKRSQLQEKSVAKQFNAKTTVASGAFWGMKADVRNDRFLIECKTTSKDYYSVTSTVWEKIHSEAIRDGMRIPLLIIDLEDRDRIVVFNPNSFVKGIPCPYECSYKKSDGKKSRRVSLKELEEINEEVGYYVYAKLFIICGNHKNMLCYMREKDFIEYYKEEF